MDDGYAVQLINGSSPRMWGTPAFGGAPSPSQRFIPTHVGNTANRRSLLTRSSVHPHACGEHFFGIRRLNALAGSSPRMWGTLPDLIVSIYQVRFIPTHVGNTTAPPPPPGCHSVHPHACGEHVFLLLGLLPFPGSSPRMWGTPQPGPTSMYVTRFIPTHVGNTRFPSVYYDETDGSSPRMWGTRVSSRPGHPAARFIPTHVGNTAHQTPNI